MHWRLSSQKSGTGRQTRKSLFITASEFVYYSKDLQNLASLRMFLHLTMSFTLFFSQTQTCNENFGRGGEREIAACTDPDVV